MVYEYLLKVHDSVPFPFLDSFELWLLDRQGQPLALLDSALTAEKIDMRQAGAWNPGLNCRKTFMSSGCPGTGRRSSHRRCQRRLPGQLHQRLRRRITCRPGLRAQR